MKPCVRPCNRSRFRAARHLYIHRREGRRRPVQITNNTQSLRMFPDPISPYMFIYLITEPSRAIRSDQAQVHETVMESVYMSPELCILKVVPARLQSQFLARQACLLAYSIAGLLVSCITLHYSSLAGRKEAGWMPNGSRPPLLTTECRMHYSGPCMQRQGKACSFAALHDLVRRLERRLDRCIGA